MVFVKHEWGMRHFVEHTKKYAHEPNADRTNENNEQSEDPRQGGTLISKCEPMREVIASFFRELRYGLSGDS